MFEADLELLCSPTSGSQLRLLEVNETTSDGEILTATLIDDGEGTQFPIVNGIPRFVADKSYNASWDYKWRVLDRGRGLNYRIIDKKDPAYQIHDLFDRNGYSGEVYKHATGKIALDAGCGIGQYSVRLMQDYSPRRLVAVDLTSGVDIFRKVIERDFPELRKKILIVQANIFDLPFPKDQFDFVMSLGVLMHTGDTIRAIGNILEHVKVSGHVNFWIYASEPVAYDVEEKHRGHVYDMETVKSLQTKYRRVQRWLRLFRKIPHDRTVQILKFMSSDFVYRMTQMPRGRFIQNWFPVVEHPNYDYRLINNYDGYVNSWCDTWNEHEIFPIMKQNGFVIRDLAGWRLGVWGVKDPDFYKK